LAFFNKTKSAGARIGEKAVFYLISVKPLPALAKLAMKSRTFFIPGPRWGGASYDWLRSSLPEHSDLVKTGLIKLAHNTCSFFFYFDNELQKSKCHEL
jgi:hypothetical protein